MSGHPTRRLTGRHVLVVALAVFGTSIAANPAMLFAATGSFPRLVVENAYMASQGWDARATAQEALGWRAETAWRDGRLIVFLRDADRRTVEGAAIEATVGRPSSAAEDRAVPLGLAQNAYTAPVALAHGAWRVEVRTVAGPAFAVVDHLNVPERR